MPNIPQRAALAVKADRAAEDGLDQRKGCLVLRVSANDLAALDAVRGGRTRAQCLRELFYREAGLPPPPVRTTTAPEPLPTFARKPWRPDRSWV